MKIFTFNVSRFFIFLLVFALLGFGEKLAYAYFGESNYTAYWLSNDLEERMMELGDLNREAKKWEDIVKKEGNKKSNSNDSQKSINIVNYHFEYNPEISVLVRNKEIERVIRLGNKLGTMDTEKENLLHEGIGQIDIMKTVGEGLKNKGHSPHSLATAMAYWAVSHLQIVHDTPFTDKQLAAVVEQFEKNLKGNGRKMHSDAEKQMAAEHLMWTATLQLLSYQNIRENSGSASALRDVADVSRAIMKEEFNLDADKMMIGDKGLMSK